MRHYPLDIIQMPESSAYYSQGHHAHQEFRAALLLGWNAVPGHVSNGREYCICWEWWRVDPPQPGEDRTVQQATMGTRGAFPVTVVYATEWVRT
mgnify:CR=1 FL=1